jgi:hypothetical protein
MSSLSGALHSLSRCTRLRRPPGRRKTDDYCFHIQIPLSHFVCDLPRHYTIDIAIPNENVVREATPDNKRSSAFFKNTDSIPRLNRLART